MSTGNTSKGVLIRSVIKYKLLSLSTVLKVKAFHSSPILLASYSLLFLLSLIMTPWRPLNIVVGLSFLHNLDTMYNSKDSALLLVDFHCAPSLSDAASSLSSARQTESIIFLISQLFLMRLLPCIMVVARLQLGSIGEGAGARAQRELVVIILSSSAGT